MSAYCFGRVTFSDVIEPERLLALTRKALVEASQPKVSYEVDVAALYGDGDDLRETVAVIDMGGTPEWRLTTRIMRHVRTYRQPGRAGGAGLLSRESAARGRQKLFSASQATAFSTVSVMSVPSAAITHCRSSPSRKSTCSASAKLFFR